MAKKKPTKAESDHMNQVAALGCIACMNMGHQDTPAEIHHTRFNAGGGQRSGHFSVLPLCFHHHSAQGVDGIHGGIDTWQQVHGTEQELLKQVEGLLG